MNKIKYTIILAFAFVLQMQSQNSSDLLAHYKTYYIQMQQLGDTQGIINAMNHLIILEPNIKRQDTLVDCEKTKNLESFDTDSFLSMGIR